jgi:hypothetical protein
VAAGALSKEQVEGGTPTAAALTHLTPQLAITINTANPDIPIILSCVDIFIYFILTQSMQHVKVHRGSLSRARCISQFAYFPNRLAAYFFLPRDLRDLRPRPLAWRGFRGFLPVVGPGLGDFPRGGTLPPGMHVSLSLQRRGPSRVSSLQPSTSGPAGACWSMILWKLSKYGKQSITGLLAASQRTRLTDTGTRCPGKGQRGVLACQAQAANVGRVGNRACIHFWGKPLDHPS